MAKRFTDTQKWKKKFVRSLDASHKLLWFYILDDCDHCGIWETDFEVASLRIGDSIDPDKALKIFEKHIRVFDNGEKWFIKSFITFQYGELNPNNRATNSVIQKLKYYNLIDENLDFVDGASKHHTSTFKGVQDKDKDKDKDKVKDIITRKQKFEKYVIENFSDKFQNEMLNEFNSYWTEYGINDKKMRWEKQTSFGVGRRLGTWSKNYKPNVQNKNVNFDTNEMNDFKI